jgi:SAM-dependent methyltransferase
MDDACGAASVPGLDGCCHGLRNGHDWLVLSFACRGNIISAVRTRVSRDNSSLNPRGTDMDIEDLQKNWDELGKVDPLWSILTEPDKKGNKWDTDDFYATGKREIDLVMEYVGSLGVDISHRKALDFGCGAGRLTQPLANYFDAVYGVDIAPSMIELAKRYNRHGDKCKYYVNDTDDLALFSDNSFDFIYTNITLQHMEPRYFRNYIREFLRTLGPDGLLIFQLPSEHVNAAKALLFRIVPLGLLNAYRKLKYSLKYGDQPVMEFHWMRREDVIDFLEENGASIVDIQQDQSRSKEWVSFRYSVTRRGSPPASSD